MKELRTENGIHGFGEVIHEYTRAQAIDDGVLVELPKKMAEEAGWNYPVACTRSVYEDVIFWDNEVEETYQDIDGRMWDVLWMASYGARKARTLDGNNYQFHFLMNSIPSGTTKSFRIKLKGVLCGGDDGSPVITIMKPDED